MRKSSFFITQTLLTTALVGAFSLSADAATLPKYRENVEHLKSDLDSLMYPEEDSTEAENAKLTRQVLAEFPVLLPAREQIEWKGASFETNNQWIYDALQRFDKEPADSPKRLAILLEVRERLAAIETKLDELEKQSAVNNTKDEDKRRLAEILRREAYQKPEEKKDNFIEEMFAKIADWIDKMFPRPNLSPASGSGFQSFSFVLQMLLYALILGAIGFLIYRFAPFLLNKYREKEKHENKERVILGERLAVNETARNLFDEAENLARQGNLRGAIRTGYIAFLCELSEKKLIGLSQHKTNRDYLRDVRRRTDLYKNLSGLTDSYERHWYGFENAAEQDWEEFKNEYQRAISPNY